MKEVLITIAVLITIVLIICGIKYERRPKQGECFMYDRNIYKVLELKKHGATVLRLKSETKGYFFNADLESSSIIKADCDVFEAVLRL